MPTSSPMSWAIAIAAVAAASSALAESESPLVRDARAAATAFGCSIVAPDPAEAARLLDIGVKAGRSYFERLKVTTPADLERDNDKIPVILGAPYAVSNDFTLGVIYEDLTSVIQRDLARGKPAKDADLKILKDQRYAQRNCSLIK